MKKISKITFTIIMVATMSYTSCGRMTKEEYNSIKGRHYTLQRFLYHKALINSKIAFDVIKKFPVKKIMKILEHKYNITIDSSEFEEFLYVNDETKLSEEGILSTLNYVWQSKTLNSNSIELKLIKNEDTPSPVYPFDLVIIIRSDNKKKASFSASLNSLSAPLPVIAERLRYKPLKEGNDNIYINMDNNTRLDLAAVSNTPEPSKQDYMQKLLNLEKSIKTTMDSIPVKDRKKFRDDLVRYLNGTVK